MTAAVDHTIAEDDQPAPITLTGVIDTVKTERVGSALSADAASGAGSVFVDDTGDFDGENGGTLSLGGTQYPYVAVNDSTGEITLSGTLSASASDGDYVSVWDVAAGEAAQDIVCLIALPGKQATDDFMYATAAPGVADKLALGQREPGQGESVRIISYDGGLEWEVINVQGKKPHIQPDYTAGGLAVTARGSFDVSDTSGFTGAVYAAPFDTDTGSEPSGVFATTAAGNIAVLQDGWYIAHVSANIIGADPGDVFKLYVFGGGSTDQGVCYAIADSTGTVDLGAHCAMGYRAAAAGTGVYGASLRQISGTGTAPSLTGCWVDLIQLTGFTP